jgi:predicted enzyme related to lactoylglutathione lyase
MGRVIHFEIHAMDPERAAKFYRDCFGWQIESWGGPMEYWMVTTGAAGEPGIDGGIMKRAEAADGDSITSYVNTIDVDDLEAAMAKIRQSGGSITTQKSAVPGVGWLAYAKDTEGNRFGIMQSDTNAA